MLLVLAPHRSGTSLTARMLECLGAVNSLQLHPANEFNLKGYFEDLDAHEFNEKVLLPELRSSWHAVSPLNFRSLSAKRHRELQAQATDIIRRNYDVSNALSVLKEPRISLLLPFWLEAIASAGFVVKAVCPVRDPLSVARSLAARDRLPPFAGGMVYFRAWESVLKSLDAIQCAFFDFGDIFADPTTTLRDIADALELPQPPDFRARTEEFADSHLDASLLHEKPDYVDQETSGPQIPVYASQLYDLLLSCTKTQDVTAAKDFCLRAATELANSTPYLNALDETASGLADLNGQLRDLAGDNATLRISLENAAQRSAELSADNASLQASLNGTERQIAVLQESLDNAERQITELAASKVALQDSLGRAEDGLRVQKKTISDLRASTSWKVTRPLRSVGDFLRRLKQRGCRPNEQIAGLPRGEVSCLPLTRQQAHSLVETGLFDAAWYSRTYSDVETSALPPLQHYFQHGHREGRAPGPLFDPEWYAVKNTEVATNGLDPLTHFLINGKKHAAMAKRPKVGSKSTRLSLSIVVPTHNRASLLPVFVERVGAATAGLNFELIIVDDGSTDETKATLRHLASRYHWLTPQSILNRGAGIARNHGAASATKDVILFLGDDILPASPHFFTAHLHYHEEVGRNGFAVLGKVEWPKGDPAFEITSVMHHIQGSGGEQFGYADMPPHRRYGWRAFYTCNLSLKRTVVDDWMSEGFSPSFGGCGFEDAEFACRLSKKHRGFVVFYADESLGHHYHRHTVASFSRRQRYCGAMADPLLQAHPELLHELPLGRLKRELRKPATQAGEEIELNLSLAEDLIAWAEKLEKEGRLGLEHWHKALLHCIFELSMDLGYLEQVATPACNYAAALSLAVSSSCAVLERALPRKEWAKVGFPPRSAHHA